MDTFDNNSFLQGTNISQDNDCCFSHVFSWGRSPGASSQRQQELKYLVRLMHKAWYPKPSGPPGKSTEQLKWAEENIDSFTKFAAGCDGYLTQNEVEWIHKISSHNSMMVSPPDLLIKVSERVKHLENEDLWLSTTDKDWHRPLLITLRETAYRNWRKRSAVSWAIRASRKKTPAE